MPAIVIGKPKPGEQIPGQQPPPGQQPAAAGGSAALLDDIPELMRRIRTMEERYNTLQSKVQLIEQNMISYHKQAIGETKTLNTDIREISRQIEQIKDKIMTLIKEIQLSAKKDEVKVLERYINLWEPINFVTKGEVIDLIKEELENNK